MSERHVTIIGAGIVGVACAATLQREGHRVTVVDPRPPGEACSFGNAGIVAPGACLPLAMPGLWRQVPGFLLDPLGPLAIDWRYLPRALPWLAGWLRASTHGRVREISAAMRALHAPALDTLRPLLRDAGADELLRQSGQLYVSQVEHGALGTPFARELLAEAGVRTEALGPDELRQLEPALSRELKSGLFFPDNGHVRDPGGVVRRLAEHVVRNGGEIVREEVLHIACGEAGVTSLACSDGPRPVDQLVVAAGAWSGRLAAKLGARVPLIAERGYHVMVSEPGRMPSRPISHVDRRFAATPMETGLRLAGTVEIADRDAPPTPGRARRLLEHGRTMFPGLREGSVTEWMGGRPALPDGLPVIDRLPRARNAVLAFGHAHHGLMGAAPTARLVAELLGGRPPTIDPRPYSAARFS